MRVVLQYVVGNKGLTPSRFLVNQHNILIPPEREDVLYVHRSSNLRYVSLKLYRVISRAGKLHSIMVVVLLLVHRGRLDADIFYVQ